MLFKRANLSSVTCRSLLHTHYWQPACQTQSQTNHRPCPWRTRELGEETNVQATTTDDDWCYGGDSDQDLGDTRRAS